MAKNTSTTTDTRSSKLKDEQLFGDVNRHYETGFHETTRRATGRNRIGSISFDEADELFRSWIDEAKWPYDALLFDPRIFTFIFEKTSRLISNKPQGHLIPREGSDILAAKINNVLLDYQWDIASNGGAMISKWSLMDINARKYGASFGLCKWRYECASDGTVLFDGPEMNVLNNRDVSHDLTATSIENCNWFQVRQYVTLQDLENVNDQRSKPVYKNLDKLRFAIGKDNGSGTETTGGGGDTRGSNWISRNRAIAGLELDPTGKDAVFKTIEVVTEYRRDRWITFAPKHGVLLRDIPNPYKNNEIPVTMLRYYEIDDDLYGVSEIEPIKGLQKAINAILSQYVDEINQKLYSPIAIGPGVRQHTLDWGKGARWIMNNPLSDFRLVESQSNAAQYFQTTYSVLVAAMQNALGESSLGVSNVQPFQHDKTATEVKALQIQRNARDNYNQIFLGEAIKRQMMLWHSMNKLLLFSDPKQKYYIIRVVGRDALKFFQGAGLDQQQMDDDLVEQMGAAQIQDASKGLPSAFGPEEITTYKYPINKGDKNNPDYVSKLQMESGNTSGNLYIEPQDLTGSFDFAVDVQSMTVSSDEERKQARQAAVTLLSSNPNVIQLLGTEGVKPKFKELFVSWLEDLGFSDAERFFETVPQGQGGAAGGDQLGQLLGALKGGQAGAPGGAPQGAPQGAPPQTPQGGPAPQPPPQQANGQQSPDASGGTMSPQALQGFFNR